MNRIANATIVARISHFTMATHATEMADHNPETA